MGGNSSKPQKTLKKKEIKSLTKDTKFSQDELTNLYEHFKLISATRDNDGLIDLEEFMEALDLKDKDFAERIFGAFDNDSDGTINFREFVCGVSVFCRGDVDEKLELSFKIYDIDGNGFISKEELMFILKATVFDMLDMSETHMKQLVDSTFAEADDNGDGLISFEEYRAMVMNHPQILNNFQLDPNVIMNLTTEDQAGPA